MDTELDPWFVGFFEGRGRFCQTQRFLLEARSTNAEPLEHAQRLVGGHIYRMPSRPNETTWRVYGAAAVDLYQRLRPHLSAELRAKGDAKLERVNGIRLAA